MKKTLVVMAAGMGSRFGGLKQIEPIGPNGEFIIDYAIYDAIKVGFNKVVFIIKKEMEQAFHETIGKRIEKKIDITYVYQDLNDLPSDIMVPKERIKPLGTAHALYCAREAVKEDFAVISADDFYGREAFKDLSDFLDKSKDFGVIGYKIGNTIPKEGIVKRGICFTNKGILTDIVECTVERKNKKIYATALEKDEEYILDDKVPVSMLMYALRPTIFDYLKEDIKEFFKDKDLNTIEYLLPSVLDEAMKKKVINIKLVPTQAKWVGITYKSDLEKLKKTINNLIEKGEYPKKLWG